MLLNNYSCPHSRGANCKEDINECLQNLDFFLIEKKETSNVSESSQIINSNKEIRFAETHDSDAGQSNHVCGWILKKCYKNVKGCKSCKSLLKASILDHRFAYKKPDPWTTENSICWFGNKLYVNVNG